MAHARLLVPLLLGCLLLLAPAPAAAQGKAPRARDLDQLAKLTGMPLARLKALKAERLFETDVYGRRALIEAMTKDPKEDMLPLVSYIAAGDSDWPTQLTAVKVLSCFGLLADRRDVLATCFPLLELNCSTGESQLLRYSMDEVLRLNRWFRCDKQIAPLLLKHFKGRDKIMQGFAYRGLTQFKHPELIEEVVIPGTWTVFNDKKIDRDTRRHAIRTFAKHEIKAALPKIQKATREGPVAIVSAYALARFLDPSSLKALRKVSNKAAVHRLRMGAWLARVRLNDPKCLKEIVKIVGDHTEHDEIKRTFLGDLGAMTIETEKVRKILMKMKTHKNPSIKLGSALGLAKLGDDSGVDLLVEALVGPWPDDLTLRWRGHGWKRRFGFMESLIRVDTPAVDKALIAMMTLKAPREHLYEQDKEDKTKEKDRYELWFRNGSRRTESMKAWYDEYRAEAVSLCGERRVKDALDELRGISKKSWGHLKFHALISQIELGDAKALGLLKWFLPKYDDRIYGDVRAIMGKITLYTNRMNWSTVFDVCDKFERVGDGQLYLPILEALLMTENKADDPMKKGWAKTVRGGPKPAKGSTAEKREPGEEPKLFRPPEVPYLLRNQFARRRVIECIARLANDEAAPHLARALRDSRATVRAAALVEIGRISKSYVLHPGSGLAAELEVWPAAVSWLDSKGAWPE